MKQGDLPFEGLALGYEGAERAANRAGVEWKDAAYEALCLYAVKHVYFTTEDVRLANPDLDDPPDRRAWGAVVRRAKMAGVIEFETYDRAKSPNVHGSIISVWFSKVYAP